MNVVAITKCNEFAQDALHQEVLVRTAHLPRIFPQKHLTTVDFIHGYAPAGSKLIPFTTSNLWSAPRRVSTVSTNEAISVFGVKAPLAACSAFSREALLQAVSRPAATISKIFRSDFW